jgi:glucokinase
VNDNEFTIGIDIGATNTVIGAVDNLGACLSKSSFPTTDHKHVEEFIRQLTLSIERLSRKLPASHRLCGIGLAAPAARHRGGIIKDPANLRWGTVNLVDILKRHYGLPIAITNDSNAAALGEMNYGAGRGMQNFIVITLGTGLGAGVVTDGRLLYGNNDTAGELGHVILEPGGRQCGCQRRGCAETYVSASGIRRTAFELLARDNDDSALRGISFNELTSKKIYELACEGDVVASRAFAVTGEYLGRLLANAAAAFDPQAIILSGGLAEAGELLLLPTRKSFEENVLGLHTGAVEIVASSIGNGNAAILGASCLVLEDAGQSVSEKTSDRLVSQL